MLAYTQDLLKTEEIIAPIFILDTSSSHEESQNIQKRVNEYRLKYLTHDNFSNGPELIALVRENLPAKAERKPQFEPMQDSSTGDGDQYEMEEMNSFNL